MLDKPRLGRNPLGVKSATICSPLSAALFSPSDELFHHDDDSPRFDSIKVGILAARKPFGDEDQFAPT